MSRYHSLYVSPTVYLFLSNIFSLSFSFSLSHLSSLFLPLSVSRFLYSFPISFLFALSPCVFLLYKACLYQLIKRSISLRLTLSLPIISPTLLSPCLLSLHFLISFLVLLLLLSLTYSFTPHSLSHQC